MELALYPDEFKGTEEERFEEMAALRRRIKKFRYRNMRNFLNECFEDTANGILQEDAAKSIIHWVKGYRDRIEWEEIAGGHQLTVNGFGSPWMDIKVPAETSGYMAFRTAKNECRVIRIFNVEKFTVKRD
jgi:hypothetical protein